MSRPRTLGQLGEIFDGPHSTPRRLDEGPFFLNISSLDKGRLNLELSDHVSHDDFARWTKRVQPQAGDLLFSYETRLGEAALMPANVAACLGRRMGLLRPNTSVVDPRFLLYYYLSPSFQGTIAARAVHGATVSRIPLIQLGSWPVHIPELEEQRAIGEVLGALDDKIAANHRLTMTLDQLASALIAGSFGETTVPLGSIARITMGTSPPGESLNEGGQGLPFYQGTRDFGFRHPVQRVYTVNPIRLAAPGDILISVRAPVGELNVAHEECCVGRGLAAIRSRMGTQATLFHLLKLRSQVWAQFNGSGTVFGSINVGDLHAIPVVDIAGDRRGEVEDKLSSIEQSIGGIVRESATLARTRDMILPKLMSGELRVRDAEKLVEDVV